MTVYIISSLLFLWLFFIALTRIVGDAKTKDDLNDFQLYLVYIFIPCDIFINITTCSLLFWQKPESFGETLTMRVTRIIHSGDFEEYEWRFRLAYFMCRYMIEPWHFGHCKLSYRNQ